MNCMHIDNANYISHSFECQMYTPPNVGKICTLYFANSMLITSCVLLVLLILRLAELP